MTHLYVVECVCGWSIERESDAANLPEDNNREIARKTAEIHETRPRFGRDETHSITEVKQTENAGKPEEA